MAEQSDDDLRQAARAAYGSDDIEIDDNAIVSRGDDGAFVAAWVWVRFEDDEDDEDDEEDETDEDDDSDDETFEMDACENCGNTLNDGSDICDQCGGAFV